MEDLEKLKVKNWKETAKFRNNLDRRGWESENSQRVVVPNDNDDVVSWAVPVGNVSWMMFQEGRSSNFS